MEYNLSDSTRILFLTALKDLSQETRIEWIKNPDFYYEPLDYLSDADREDALILYQEQSNKILQFLRTFFLFLKKLKNLSFPGINFEVKSFFDKNKTHKAIVVGSNLYSIVKFKQSKD